LLALQKPMKDWDGMKVTPLLLQDRTSLTIIPKWMCCSWRMLLLDSTLTLSSVFWLCSCHTYASALAVYIVHTL
jgi:hypothetical protein